MIAPPIRDHIIQNSIIHSDQYAVYNYMYLPNVGYVHRTVNHSEEFVVPDGMHTNIIKGFWVNMG